MVEPTKVNCVTVVFGKQPLPPKIEELYPWFFARYGRWICDNMLGVGEGWNCNRAPYYIYIYIYVFIVKTVFEQITCTIIDHIHIINIRTARKSAQHFHQFSCSLWFSSCWKRGICHLFISWWCLLALHFHWDLWKIIVLLQWEFKNACWTPSKYATFFGWRCVSPQRQRFFSITSTSGPSLQWYHTHQHFYVCIAIAKPWHMSWSLDFG